MNSNSISCFTKIANLKLCWQLAVITNFIGLTILIQAIHAQTHPFMIVKESEYAALRNRSAEHPWSEMKKRAITNAKNLIYDSGAEYKSKCWRAHDIASACALAYILDPESKSIYIDKIQTDLKRAIDYIAYEKGSKTNHDYNVKPAHATFMTYLVLDIMYNDLSPEIRQAIENDCDFIASNHKSSWYCSKYSIEGMMELYHNGKTIKFESIKDDYLNYVLDLTTNDGVFAIGPGYTKSRMFQDKRMQKKIFMDICEYQGYHEFYSNPKLQNLYEWIVGYSTTPFNRTYTFGDTPPTKDIDHWAVSALRANRFSNKAQQYATWRLGPLTENEINGGLLHYILCDSLPKAPVRPGSRIFKNGGAWLLEDSESDRALAVALWNTNTPKSSHKHFDVNAIHIAAYGEHIMRNSGYDGYGKPNPELWDWIHSTAASSNTLLINGKNHSSGLGDGITEGIIGEDLEYASGDAGSAMLMAHHQRNIIFVKPQNGINSGYFAVVDEARAGWFWGTETKVNILWHPNSAEDPLISENEKQYQWNIGGCNYSNHPVDVTIFLGTSPINAEVKTGYKGSYSSCSRFYGKYIDAEYGLNDNKETSIVTAIFPHETPQPEVSFQAIDTLGASGIGIDHGNLVVDYIMSKTDTASLHYQDVLFHGKAVCFRKKDWWDLKFYFVRKGKMFLHTVQFNEGFSSDSDITIFVKEGKGQIISPGANVKFYDSPGVKKVYVDDMPAPIIESGVGWATVYIDSGQYEIRIEKGVSSVAQKLTHEIGKFELSQNYPNPFNQNTTIGFDLSVSAKVNLKIFSATGKEIATLVSKKLSSGKHQLSWNPGGLSSGVYFYRLIVENEQYTTGKFVQTKKLILLK